MLLKLFAYSRFCCLFEPIHADDLQRPMTRPIGQFLTLGGISTFGDERSPGVFGGCELEEVGVHVVVDVLGGLFRMVGEDGLRFVPADWMGEDGVAEGHWGGVVGTSAMHY